MAHVGIPPAGPVGWVVRYSTLVQCPDGRRRQAFRIVWAQSFVKARELGGDFEAQIRMLPAQIVRP